MSTAATASRPRRTAQLLYRGLRASGATFLSRRLHDAALILCYHNVVTTNDAGGDPELHVPVERFERQVRWLAGHYDVVSLREIVGRLARGGPLRRLAAITFDDGYAGVFEHALPLLASLGLTATVFVVADAPDRAEGFWWDHPAVVASLTPTRRERWLTFLRGDGLAILAEVDPNRSTSDGGMHRAGGWRAIRAAAEQGFEIGAHSATHRALPMLTDAEVEYEVVASRDAIHQASGVRPEFFAYPYGLWDARSCDAVRRAGYVAGLGLDLGLNGPASDRSCLRRVNVPAGISTPAFEAWAAGLSFHRS